MPLIRQKYEPATLSIEGSITLDSVTAVKDAFMKALSQSDELVVDINAATEVDVAGLQLLCACYRFAMHRNKTISLKGEEPSPVMQAMDRIGLSQCESCNVGFPVGCMWTQAVNRFRHNHS